MNFKILISIILIVVLISVSTFFIYQYHKSVDQKLSLKDIEIKNILEKQENQVKSEEDTEEDTNDVILEDFLKSFEKTENKKENEVVKNVEVILEKENQVKILKTGKFNPDATDSDVFHKGEGEIQIIDFNGEKSIIFKEDFFVTNGPDFKIYLVKNKNIDTKKAFEEIKSDSYNITHLKQFSGYQSHQIPKNININEIKGVVIWCEIFSQFISTANLN